MYFPVDGPQHVAGGVHELSEPFHKHLFVFSFELVDVVFLGDLQAEEGAVLGHIPSASELPLLLILAFRHSLNGDHLFGEGLVGGDVIEEGGDPLGGLCGFDSKWGEYNILVADGLAVDPGVGVVELEDVQSAAGSHDAAGELPRLLLLLDQQLLARTLAVDLPRVEQPYRHVQRHHVDLEVEQGIVLQHLEAAPSFETVLYHKGIGDFERVEWLHGFLLVSDEALLCDLAGDFLDPRRLLGQEISELAFAEFADDAEEEDELVGEGEAGGLIQLVVGLHEEVGGRLLLVVVVGVEVPEHHLHQDALLARFQIDCYQPPHHYAHQVRVALLAPQEELERAVLVETLKGLVVLLELGRQHLVGEQDVEEHLRQGHVQERKDFIRPRPIKTVQSGLVGAALGPLCCAALAEQFEQVWSDEVDVTDQLLNRSEG